MKKSKGKIKNKAPDFWQTVKSEQKKFQKASTGSYKPFKRKARQYKTSSGQKDYSQLSQAEEYVVLAARANKRLQRLEKYAQRSEYSGLEKASYARAIYDIQSLRGEGRTRFARQMPTDPNEANAALNFIRKFLGADTSTLQPGIGTAGASIARYEEMARKFNTRFTSDQGGEALTWREITTWYASYNGKRIAKKIGSSAAVAVALGQFKKIMKENPKKTLKEFKEELEKNPDKIYSSDVVANEAMKLMIQSNVSPQNLFKKRN